MKEGGLTDMKKLYETPVAVVATFSSEDMTNVQVSNVTGLDKVSKTFKNTINF
jgi:hypothetical protein